jgi:hypothetical protein
MEVGQQYDAASRTFHWLVVGLVRAHITVVHGPY